MKLCLKCNTEKSMDEFVWCNTKEAFVSPCKSCIKKQPSKIKGSLQYFKTRRWAAICSRTINSGKAFDETKKSYVKNPVLLQMTKKEFDDFCDANSQLILSLKKPSVDRFNSKLGYFVGNLRIIEHSENVRCAAVDRWRKDPRSVYAVSLDKKQKLIFNRYYDARNHGFHVAAIYRCLNGKQSSHKGFSWSYV